MIEVCARDDMAPLTPEELARVKKYIERTSRKLPRCPVADFCDDELQGLLKRFLVEKERARQMAGSPPK